MGAVVVNSEVRPNERTTFARPRGVTVSTLDSESSGRGSNPREAYSLYASLLAKF